MTTESTNSFICGECAREHTRKFDPCQCGSKGPHEVLHHASVTVETTATGTALAEGGKRKPQVKRFTIMRADRAAVEIGLGETVYDHLGPTWGCTREDEQHWGVPVVAVTKEIGGAFFTIPREDLSEIPEPVAGGAGDVGMPADGQPYPAGFIADVTPALSPDQFSRCGEQTVRTEQLPGTEGACRKTGSKEPCGPSESLWDRLEKSLHDHFDAAQKVGEMSWNDDVPYIKGVISNVISDFRDAQPTPAPGLTPRTDAMEHQYRELQSNMPIPVRALGLARTLERELAAANLQIESHYSVWNVLAEMLGVTGMQIQLPGFVHGRVETMVRELADARAEAERLKKAVKPFANYACDPVGSCVEDGAKCHNCIAKETLQ